MNLRYQVVIHVTKSLKNPSCHVTSIVIDTGYRQARQSTLDHKIFAALKSVTSRICVEKRSVYTSELAGHTLCNAPEWNSSPCAADRRKHLNYNI